MTKQTPRSSAHGYLVLLLGIAFGSIALADSGRYDVSPKRASRAEGAPVEYEAENPNHKLRFAFPLTGLVGGPEYARNTPWSFDFRLSGLAFDGTPSPIGPARMSASENRVDYELGTVRVSYVNTPAGLEQLITIAEPDIRGKAGAPATVAVELTVGGDLRPTADVYFINMVGADGEALLRYGPVEAHDADGKRLDAKLEIAKGDDGAAAGARVTVSGIDPVYPIEVRTTVSSPSVGKVSPAPEPTASASEEIVGVPVTLQAGIVETVEKIMEREKLNPAATGIAPRETHHEMDLDEDLKEDPNAPPPMSHWPPIPPSASSAAPGEPNLPQTVGTVFKGIGISESGFIPPDTMGDVGPTQILMHSNGRIKVFSKTGALGGLNASEGSFWGSLSPSGGVSDPQVRYDRLSGRWFVLAIDLASTNNKILLAVSSGSTISNVGSFMFYSFNIGAPAPADASCFCDYPGLGIDANAIYTGCNMFSCGFHTSAFVIRKSSVLSGGPIVVTGFSNIGNSGSAGPYAPRGVDNDDPTFGTGFILGSDPGVLNRLNIRKVTNPGTTPVLGPTITIPISSTNMQNQKASGSTIDINTSDARFYAASIHKNKITGALSLWTAHAVETDTTCTPQGSGDNRRIGARWYQLGNLSGTPTITQFGTLCTTAVGSTTSNTERGFFYPSVVQTGQGHMALGSSFASATEFVGTAAAGRLRTDPAGGTRAPETIVQVGLASYTIGDPNRNRWGDYSFTDVDPTDDQTIWTFQEYADATNNTWAVQAIQLKAPPPPTSVVAGDAVCNGYAAAPLTLTGVDSCPAPSCTNGLCTGGGACPEFFDPGPDTGGPGYSKHLVANVTGGITVNSVSIVPPANPATDRVLTVSLSLNTAATTLGNKTVSIVNPDGQAKTYNNIFTVVGNRTPVSNAGGPYAVCLGGGATLNGGGSTDADTPCGDSIVTYEWDLNNDTVIDTTGVSPTVTAGQLSSLGLGVGSHTITLKVTDSKSATHTASGTLTILANGVACSDGNACTQTDTCQSGTCTGSNPVVCTASDVCHVAGVCNTGTGVCSNPNAPNGTACSDGNACTQTDACSAGVCLGTNPVICNDNNQCTTDSCNTGTGACSNTIVTDGTSCNDANACTQSDTCQAGTCTGANPVVCNPSNACHLAGTCNTVTGVCSNPNAPNGTPCSDANACTQTDACQAGACVGSNPVICDDGDPCTTDSCNTGTGACTTSNAPNGTACNDANACTQTDSCQSGACTGANPVVCTASDTCHLAGVCDPGNGVCTNPEAPDGTPCNDLDATTCDDLCSTAVCGGTPVPEPPEMDGSLLLDKSPTNSTLTWTDAPGPYGVYRGSNGPPGSPWSYDQTCLMTGVAGTSFADTAIPLPGEFFYYLITRFDQCRESVLGTDSNLTTIPNSSPCAAP